MVRSIRGAKVSRKFLKAEYHGNNASKFLGETTLNVKIISTIKQHTLLVVNNNLSLLLGRDFRNRFHFTVNV